MTLKPAHSASSWVVRSGLAANFQAPAWLPNVWTGVETRVSTRASGPSSASAERSRHSPSGLSRRETTWAHPMLGTPHYLPVWEGPNSAQIGPILNAPMLGVPHYLVRAEGHMRQASGVDGLCAGTRPGLGENSARCEVRRWIWSAHSSLCERGKGSKLFSAERPMVWSAPCSSGTSPNFRC
jgi:hypothetical protein